MLTACNNRNKILASFDVKVKVRLMHIDLLNDLPQGLCAHFSTLGTARNNRKSLITLSFDVKVKVSLFAY
jgi:hypothetical protein